MRAHESESDQEHCNGRAGMKHVYIALSATAIGLSCVSLAMTIAMSGTAATKNTVQSTAQAGMMTCDTAAMRSVSDDGTTTQSPNAWIGAYAEAQQHAYAVPSPTDADYSVDSIEHDGTYVTTSPYDGQLLRYDDGYYIVRCDSSIASELLRRPVRLTLDGVDYVYASCRWYGESASYDQSLAYARQDGGIGIQTNLPDSDTVVVMHYVPADSDVPLPAYGNADGSDVRSVPSGSWIDEYGVIVPNPTDAKSVSLASSSDASSSSRRATAANGSVGNALDNCGNGLYIARAGSSAAQCVIARNSSVSIDGVQYAYDGCRVVRSDDGDALMSARHYATSGQDVGIVTTYDGWTIVMRCAPVQGQANAS